MASQSGGMVVTGSNLANRSVARLCVMTGRQFDTDWRATEALCVREGR